MMLALRRPALLLPLAVLPSVALIASRPSLVASAFAPSRARSARAYSPLSLVPRRPTPTTRLFLSDPKGGEGDDKDEGGGGGGEAEGKAKGEAKGGAGGASSFDDASKSIAAEADAEAILRTGGLDAEEEAAFKARSGEFESMKDRIRSRASEMGVEKSVATAEAIKEAERRARSQQVSPTLDMSVFATGDAEDSPMMYNPEDELTEDEQKAIDPVGQMPFLQQALDEFSNTAFPGPLDVAKTVGFMAITFAVSASFILKSDEILRGLYTEWGFLPGPDSTLDYSDLELPADWDKDLDDLTGVFADVVEAAKQSAGGGN